jgi:MerR family transcriptional regulator/heat shock protein HspR
MSGSFGNRASGRRADVDIDERLSGEPRYAITVVARRSGVHVQTVRRYERFGLVEPRGVEPGLRLYSEADIDQVRRIRRLVDDLGINLAGVAAILHLRRQVLDLQHELRGIRGRQPDS